MDKMILGLDLGEQLKSRNTISFPAFSSDRVHGVVQFV